MADSRLHLFKGTFDVLVLKTLSWGPAHGYAISRWIRERAGEDLRVEEGALYPALRRLEERGLIASEWQRLADTGRDARVYTLTPEGVAALTTELSNWHRYVQAFARVLEATPDQAPA